MMFVLLTSSVQVTHGSFVITWSPGAVSDREFLAMAQWHGGSCTFFMRIDPWKAISSNYNHNGLVTIDSITQSGGCLLIQSIVFVTINSNPPP